VHASWIIAFPGCNYQVWNNGYGPLTFCDQYETALSKHNQGRDPNILSCLGRVWYAKGKKESKMEKEKAFESMKNSLEYAKKVSPSQPTSQPIPVTDTHMQGIGHCQGKSGFHVQCGICAE
jgi:hypothetical protein